MSPENYLPTSTSSNNKSRFDERQTSLEAIRTLIEDRKKEEDFSSIIHHIDEEVAQHPEWNARAVPTIKLWSYNLISVLRGQGRDIPDNIAPYFRTQFEKLSNEENKFKSENTPLPTIGIEVEVPFNTANSTMVAALESLGIPVYRDRVDGYGKYYHSTDALEASPSYTYSSRTQSRLLRELSMLYLNFLNPNDAELQNFQAPLHLNLSLPSQIHITDNLEFVDATNILSNLITYGYSSASRIDSGDYFAAWKEKGVDENSDNSRLELRTGQFLGSTTYAMLRKTQLLGGLYSAFLKQHTDSTLNITEQDLSNTWINIQSESQDLFKEAPQEVHAINLDEVREFMLKHVNIQKQTRSLITKYSNIAADILIL